MRIVIISRGWKSSEYLFLLVLFIFIPRCLKYEGKQTRENSISMHEVTFVLIFTDLYPTEAENNISEVFVFVFTSPASGKTLQL